MSGSAAFFDKFRGYFGGLSQNQVDGANAILAATFGLPLKHRAYMLATAWHETAHTLQPIEEIGKGAGHPYGQPDGPWHHVYYGRGYVQLTWLKNYIRANTALHAGMFIKPNEDLVRDPDLVMRPDIAAAIMVHGMSEGWFTGKKLADYTDYLNMRRVINGTDRADLIASYAFKFEECVKADMAAQPAPGATVSAPPRVSPPPPAKPAPASPVGLLAIILNILSILFSRKATK